MKSIKILALSMILLMAVDASACSCIYEKMGFKEEIKAEFEQSDNVFVGTVKSIELEENGGKLGWPENVVIFTLNDGRTMTVRTGTGGGDCGYHFEVGKDYLVYANGNTGKLYTSICSLTKEIKYTKKRELRIIKRLKKKLN